MLTQTHEKKRPLISKNTFRHHVIILEPMILYYFQIALNAPNPNNNYSSRLHFKRIVLSQLRFLIEAVAAL